MPCDGIRRPGCDMPKFSRWHSQSPQQQPFEAWFLGFAWNLVLVICSSLREGGRAATIIWSNIVENWAENLTHQKLGIYTR